MALFAKKPPQFKSNCGGFSVVFKRTVFREPYFGPREVKNHTARSMESRELPQSASSPLLR